MELTHDLGFRLLVERRRRAASDTTTPRARFTFASEETASSPSPSADFTYTSE